MSQAATAMRGRLHGADTAFRGVSTDSRRLSAGALFFALQGPHFDGADFAAQALAAGAAGVVLGAGREARAPYITVHDTRRALGRLAADWRARMPATVIGITGSNGKTTLRALVTGCLERVAATLATRGNLNNDIGLPLMLCELEPAHRFAVLEMGANHAGEIAWLTSLAAPAIAVISNAAPAHLEGFGSLDGVARAKGEILEGESRPRVAVLNADDPYFELWRSMAQDVEVLSFGLADTARVRASELRETPSGSAFRLHLPGASITVELPLPGRHNVANACAAAAAAQAAGLDAATIRAGLENTAPVAGRLQPLPGPGGARLFDDSYNANPASVTAAAEFLAAQPGAGWLVLGDMGELGRDAATLHRRVGDSVRRAGVERLFAAGPLSRHAVEAFGPGGEWFASVEALAAALAGRLPDDAPQPVNLLVKGSRFMRMERVVAALRAAPSSAGGA